ncbi:hypothetical protein LCL97_21695 [Seohaeicola saemankumensis]|nr:hypothetical protein [Seohaeicola saemankumensis]MCA0873453.1 hypothetical protein [Seohaeicola saemankumensis]
MKKMFAIAAAGLFALSGTAFAQTFEGASPEALAEAKEKGACGVGYEPRKAEYLADGRLAVLCPAGSGAAAAAAGGAIAQPAVLAGTTLGAGGAAALAGLVIVVALTGGDDTSTTTTTTTGGGN